jgi:glycerophosphoryl diester phosphodiesterase
MNQGGHTLIFAHRGSSKEAAENTRSAFERALTYPIDGIETDIQLSRDYVPVLWHDRFLIKLRHPAKHIDDFDLRELQQMNFAAHFSSGAKPEGIMLLSDFLRDYRKRTRLLLEIKNRDWEARTRHENKVRQTLELVGAVADDRILVSSFNLDSLVYAQQFRPGFPLVYNFEEEQTLRDAEEVLAAHPFLHGLCLPIASLDAAVVKLLRGQGKSIAVYTCNSDKEIATALELGVDILISDVPQKALSIRDQNR